MTRAAITMLNSMADRDFETALDRHVEWRLHHLDVKDAVFGKGVVDLSASEAQHAAELIGARGLAVYCMSTQLFHGDVEVGEQAFRKAHLEPLEHAISVARILRPNLFRLLSARITRREQVADSISYLRDEHPWVIASYREAVERLVAGGHAYRDYATADEIQAEREAAQRSKVRFIYSRRWMAETPAQAAAFEAQGRTAVVRLKMPRDGACAFDDLVRGPVEFEWALEQDHVVQRADGSCLYHLASAVDDHDFGITHVIRAVEHLSNTPRQIFIARGLGYDLPAYAHLPYVAEPGSAEKLSKRKVGAYLRHPDFRTLHEHGAAIMDALGEPVVTESFNPLVVAFYRAVGYRPEALLNYLLLLGWSLDDRTEMFTTGEMIEKFTLERVNKSAASFDPPKLLAFEERYMHRLPLAARAAAAVPFLQRNGALPEAPSPADLERVSRVVAAAGERLKVAGDILGYLEFFRPDDAFPYDEKAFAKRLRAEGAADRLGRFRAVLATVDPFDAATLHDAMQRFIAAEGIAIGRIIHAVRVAVTGKAVGFGLFEGLEILGREACLARIDRALGRLAGTGTECA